MWNSERGGDTPWLTDSKIRRQEESIGKQGESTGDTTRLRDRKTGAGIVEQGERRRYLVMGDMKISRQEESIREQGKSAGDTAGLRDKKTGRQEQLLGTEREGEIIRAGRQEIRRQEESIGEQAERRSHYWTGRQIDRETRGNKQV